MYIYLQFDLSWWHPQKIKERLGLLGLIKYRRRPSYYRPYRILLTSPALGLESILLKWCRRNIRSMTKTKKDQTVGVKKIKQRYPMTRGELRLLVKEMNMFLPESLQEPEGWKIIIHGYTQGLTEFCGLYARGLTECSLVIREKAFPLEDVLWY